MISYAAHRRAILRAERVAAIGEQIHAIREQIRANLEAVAAGEVPGRFGMTPERAARELEGLEDGLLRPDPEPAYAGPHWATDHRDNRLPAYMPPGAPRPMSVRETVQALNRLGSRVPLWLQLLASCTTARQMRRTMRSIAGRTTLRVQEQAPHWAGSLPELDVGRSCSATRWLEVCLHIGRAPGAPTGTREPWHTWRSLRVALAVQSGAVGPMPP